MAPKGRKFYYMQYSYNLMDAATLWVSKIGSQGDCSAEGQFVALDAIDHKFGMLMEATKCGDLPQAPGEAGRVKHTDLREWMTNTFPHEKPEFLFPKEPEATPADTDLLLVIAALLKQLKVTKQPQENQAMDVSELLGPRFGDSKIKKIFAEANKALSSRLSSNSK